MSDLTAFGLIFYFLSIIAIVILATLANGQVRPALRKYPVRKICWGILAVTAGYWFVGVPYVGKYYDFSTKKEFPQAVTEETVGEVLRDHHGRIEKLERSLEEARTEASQLRDYLQMLLQLLMYGVIFYASQLIFNQRFGSSAGTSDKSIKLDLDKE